MIIKIWVFSFFFTTCMSLYMFLKAFWYLRLKCTLCIRETGTHVPITLRLASNPTGNHHGHYKSNVLVHVKVLDIVLPVNYCYFVYCGELWKPSFSIGIILTR